MADLLAHRLEVIAAEAATALRQAAMPRDWLDEILDADGDGLKSDEAAHIAGVHVDTIRERAKAAAATDKPIGILMANAVWLFSRRRLLASIEAEKGLPARLAAESRARKSVESWSLPGKIDRNPGGDRGLAATQRRGGA